MRSSRTSENFWPTTTPTNPITSGSGSDDGLYVFSSLLSIASLQPNHGYNAGGSGYILSRAAMKIFAEELFEDRQSCPFHEWEDYAIARCLWSRGIYAQ